MSRLKNHQVDLILKDIRTKGLSYQRLEEEVLDYICEGVERRMMDGQPFQQAYEEVLLEFGSVKKVQVETLKSTSPIHMLRYFIMLSFRNLKAHFRYSVINIVGLSIGIMACIFIWQYIAFERSYDRYHKNSPQIFRLNHSLIIDGEASPFAKTPFPVASILKSDYPEIKAVSNVFAYTGNFQPPAVTYEDQRFLEPSFFAADPSFFDIFDINFKQGSSDQALDDIDQVIISASTAVKYFGNDEAIGKTLLFQNQIPLLVTGVFEDIPDNSHIRFDFLISIETFRKSWMSNGGPDIYKTWTTSLAWTYLLLNEGSTPEQVNAKLPALVDEYFEDDKDILNFELQALNEIHLNPIGGEIAPGGNGKNLFSLALIAILILLASCFNFVNLSAARFSQRAREVGVRKSLGGDRKVLATQFLTESIITVYLAMLIAIIGVIASLPYFNNLTEINLSPANLVNAPSLLMLAGIGLLIGLVSGIYPALVLSGLNPVKIFRGQTTVSSGSLLRKGLTVGQFVISIGLVFGIIVIYKQLDYINNKELGYEKEMVITFKSPPEILRAFDVFSARAKENSNVLAVCSCDPVFSGWSAAALNLQGHEEPQFAAFRYVGEDFEKVFGLELITGRAFDRTRDQSRFWADTTAVYVINETAVRRFGWNEAPLGKSIEFVGSSGSFKGKVIGVVKDFNYSSLHTPIEPLVMRYMRFGPISIKISNNNVQETLQSLEAIWESMAPGSVFQYTFVDDKVQQQYESDIKLGKILGHFTVIAILISCLGFLGLASFTTENRLRELGIRKVLGASAKDLIILLEKEFVLLSGLSFLLAIPISYFFVNGWLENFAFKTSIGYMLPVYLLIGQALLVMITVSHQVIKCAIKNPVDILKPHD